MAKIYNIETNQDIKENNSLYTFDAQQLETESTTYLGVLKIFRKAFNLVDLPFITKKKSENA
ncbi:MAG: hypothetical protein E6772_03960 [Dysgonomonas sp.]|nr:hypothetical protein [Dysgonomonas sp.]